MLSQALTWNGLSDSFEGLKTRLQRPPGACLDTQWTCYHNKVNEGWRIIYQAAIMRLDEESKWSCFLLMIAFSSFYTIDDVPRIHSVGKPDNLQPLSLHRSTWSQACCRAKSNSMPEEYAFAKKVDFAFPVLVCHTIKSHPPTDRSLVIEPLHPFPPLRPAPVNKQWSRRVSPS